MRHLPGRLPVEPRRREATTWRSSSDRFDPSGVARRVARSRSGRARRGVRPSVRSEERRTVAASQCADCRRKCRRCGPASEHRARGGVRGSGARRRGVLGARPHGRARGSMTPSLDSERLAVLVHEVRSPVAALSAIAEALDGDTDTETRRELVRLVTLACHGVERVVTDAAVASIRSEPTDPEQLIRDVVAGAVVRGGRVELTVIGKLPTIDADVSRLRPALDNLVANALVHGPGDGLVSIRAEAASAVLISVTDHGPGIAADEIDQIFDVGVRLVPDSQGSGLGLPLARAIVEGHGGSLTVTSILGEGTTFTIALPLRQA